MCQRTIIRASWFAQNVSETLLRALVLSREGALLAGDVREPFIDVAGQQRPYRREAAQSGRSARRLCGTGVARVVVGMQRTTQRDVIVLGISRVVFCISGGERYPAPRRVVRVRSQVMRRCSQLLGRRRGPPSACILPDFDISVRGIGNLHWLDRDALPGAGSIVGGMTTPVP